MLHILLFLKAPRAGFVKTRLAKQIGQRRALTTYKALVERQISTLPNEGRTEIHFTPVDALCEFTSWLGNSASYYPQCEGDLGSRLHSAVADAFKRGASSVICIGGDCPNLNFSHIEQTSDLLSQDKDLAIGPSEDGGYYLIGMNRPQPELFEDIPWSQPDTFKATMKKAEDMNLRTIILETLYDVDEVCELKRAVEDGYISL